MESFTTMITPYKKDGSIDYETAEKYVEMYYNAGLTGIFAICQSSEIFYLSQEERVKLNGVVYKKAKELEKIGKRKFTVVSSGHISDSPEKQAEELNEVYFSGTDALIFITNRLDSDNEGDGVFIKNAENLISKLPEKTRLGLYLYARMQYRIRRFIDKQILRRRQKLFRSDYSHERFQR